MIEEPLTANTSTTTIPDDDQPIVAVTTDEEKYLVCDSAASRNNIAQGSAEVRDYQTLPELLLTARIGASLTVIGNGTIGLLGEVKVISAAELSKNIMSCGAMSRRGFSFYIRAYGRDCLIRFYLEDDNTDDLNAGYPLTTAKLVTNNLYICLLEPFKQSMNQLISKAKIYREQRHNDRGVPRPIYQRTVINPDRTMATTLSSADYFDALDRLPDPTYGETSAERLASIIAMADSLTEEDRALVIYEPRIQPRFVVRSYRRQPDMFFSIPAEYFAVPCQDVPIDYELFLNDIVTTPTYNRVTPPQQLNDRPRPSPLNEHIRLVNAIHADFMSRVNHIEPQHRSPALIRQIQLLESQHEQYLRRILDDEVHTRSDNTRVHRRCARYATPGLRDDRWLRYNNRVNHTMARCPQPRRHGSQLSHSVPTPRRPVFVRGPRLMPPHRLHQPQPQPQP